jgi:hypothetical protein
LAASVEAAEVVAWENQRIELEVRKHWIPFLTARSSKKPVQPLEVGEEM